MPREEGRKNAKDKRAPGNSRIQGEGDYKSGERYQKDAEEFARSHDVNKLADKKRAKGKKPAPN